MAVKNKNLKKGFTLPEAVVAAALLLIAIVPVLKALTTANIDSVIIEKRTQSLYYAEGKLNQIKAKSIYDFNDITESNVNLGNSYLCNANLSTVPGNSYLKQISVSVGLDTNCNGILEDSEIDVTLQTQVAQRWP